MVSSLTVILMAMSSFGHASSVGCLLLILIVVATSGVVVGNKLDILVVFHSSSGDQFRSVLCVCAGLDTCVRLPSTSLCSKIITAYTSVTIPSGNRKHEYLIRHDADQDVCCVCVLNVGSCQANSELQLQHAPSVWGAVNEPVTHIRH